MKKILILLCLACAGCNAIQKLPGMVKDERAIGSAGDGRKEIVLSIPRSSAVQFTATDIRPIGTITLPAGRWMLVGQMGWDVIAGNPQTTVLKSYIALEPQPNKEEKQNTAANPSDTGEVMALAYGAALNDVRADDITSTMVSFPVLTKQTVFYFVAAPVMGAGVIGAYGNITAVPI